MMDKKTKVLFLNICDCLVTSINYDSVKIVECFDADIKVKSFEYKGKYYKYQIDNCIDELSIKIDDIIYTVDINH